MAEDADGGGAARVGQSSFEPVVRVLETFLEEIAKDRVEFVAHAFVDFDSLFGGLRLGVGNGLAAVGGFEILGEETLVGGHEVVVQGDRVGDELDDTACCGQGEDFVRSDPKLALAGRPLGAEQIADLFKHLLHDGVLSEVVVAGLEELFVFCPVRGDRGHNLRHTDARSDGILLVESRNSRYTAVVEVRSKVDLHGWWRYAQVTDILPDPLTGC